MKLLLQSISLAAVNHSPGGAAWLIDVESLTCKGTGGTARIRGWLGKSGAWTCRQCLIGLRKRDFPNLSSCGHSLVSPHPSSRAALPLPIPTPLQPSARHRASLLLPSIPSGAVPGVPWGAQARQLQLLLFRFKCLHLFITKTPLRFPGSSTGWATELSEETTEAVCQQKQPQNIPETALGSEGTGNRAGCLDGGWG